MARDHIEAWRNIFAVARAILDDEKLRSDAHRLHSSQAFCWSVWGTVFAPDGAAVREAVCALLDDEGVSRALRDGPTFSFEEDDRSVLREFGGGKSTLDLHVGGPGLVITVESKLTEKLDCCSQIKGKVKNCSGVLGRLSDLKATTRREPGNCRLSKRDGHRSARDYWAVVDRLAKPGAFEMGRACPFTDGTYQAMRNVTFAAQSAFKSGRDWRTIFAYPPSRETDEIILAFTGRLLPEHRHRVLRLDYALLADRLFRSPDPVARGLAEFMAPRLKLAEGRA